MTTLLIAAATLAACERATEPVIAGVGGQVNIANSAALTISPSQVSITVGATTQLSTNAGSGQQSRLQWFSTSPAIAAVSQAGEVTGLSPGTATITARFSFDTTRVATASVIVAP